MKPRVAIFGWGIVAPKSPNVQRFKENLMACDDRWLSTFDGFGPSNFLVGFPEFSFADYKTWISDRLGHARFLQIEKHMAQISLYALGAFIQSLQCNKGLEEELQRLDGLTHVYIGTSMGSTDTNHACSLALDRAQRDWDRFWSSPGRNSALAEYLQGSTDGNHTYADAPADPALDVHRCEEKEREWARYWAARSPGLQCYLQELAEIETQIMQGEMEAAKRRAFMEKERLCAKLQQKWQAPEPPWSVAADVFWNLSNTPAAQVSIVGRLTGLSFAPVAACSTFSVALRLGMRAIQNGDAKAVVIGATDPAPHPLNVSAFYSVKVLSGNADISLPLTNFRGTHLSGGAAVWILGDYEYMCSRGFVPLGLEPVAVGVSSDAEHLITPSSTGPQKAILQALHEAGVTASDVATWDMHATATPGDYQEVRNFRSVFPDTVLVTARKGIFGHGLSVAGGWELTAQYLAYEAGKMFPMPVSASQINPMIRKEHDRFACQACDEKSGGIAGKLSMGLGGINACVISKPWTPDNAH